MRHDVPRLLRAAGVDGVLLLGGTLGNPNFRYVAGATDIKGTILVPVRGRPAMLYGAMERDSLPRIEGLRAMTTAELDARRPRQGRKPAKAPSPAAAEAEQAARFLAHMKFRGTLALAGRVEAGWAVEFARVLGRQTPDVKVVDVDPAATAFRRARAAKEPAEIEFVAEAGRRTQRAVADAVAFLSACSLRRGFVVDDRGRRVTSGRVRDVIVDRLRREGMELPETPIVAAGEEAGVPHNVGTDSRPLRGGEPLVMDVFPRMSGSGYFFDMTRTVCPGRPSPELARMYDQVLKVHRACCAMVAADAVGADIDAEACRLFEGWGHPTGRTHPGTTDGYCHSLGHGVGLDIHELPNLSKTWHEPLGRGAVVTVEPGLYYPDRGVGIRIEDVLAIDAEGRVRNLCTLGKRFALPLRED